jgi:hypothetical protein
MVNSLYLAILVNNQIFLNADAFGSRICVNSVQIIRSLDRLADTLFAFAPIQLFQAEILRAIAAWPRVAQSSSEISLAGMARPKR